MSLDTWAMVGSWDFLDQSSIDQFLDKMQAARVQNLAFGGTPPLEPDPRHYRDSPVQPQTPPERIMAYRARVQSLLQAAADRGMQVFLYGTNPHMGGVDQIYRQLDSKHYLDAHSTIRQVPSYWGACANGPALLPYYLGRIRDVYQSLPQVAGFLNDGPEFGYEIQPGFMEENWNLFACFGACCKKRAEELGFDLDDLARGAVELRQRLAALDGAAIERMLTHAGGPVQALAAAVEEPRLEQWFAFKRDSIVSYIQALCLGIKEVDASYQVGIGSRLPAFTPLTGYDLAALGRSADFVLPKLYLWMGGVDGLYGTVYRWARTLKAWNPHLEEAQLFRLVYRLFGLQLPEVDCLADMARYIDDEHRDGIGWTRSGQPFPERFFSEVVAAQVETMIAQVGAAGRVRPWLDAHHGGRQLTARELDSTLQAAAGAGLQTYLYYCPMEEEFWQVAVRNSAP